MTRAHNAITFVLRNPQRLRSSVIIIARVSEEDAVKSESRSYRKVTLLKGSDEEKKKESCVTLPTFCSRLATNQV